MQQYVTKFVDSLLTGELTSQITSWEDDSSLAIPKRPIILWNPYVHYGVHKRHSYGS
jgi:hypothetical protein